MLLRLDQIQRRRRQRGVEAGKDLAEHRHYLHQQEDRDQDRHDGHHRRVHHGRFDLLAEPGGILQISRQPGENLRQQAAFFTGGDHANVEPAERLGMLLQCLGETVAAFHPRAHVVNHVAHDLVGGLLRQRLQDCTMARPASIIVASWRVKITRSARPTRPPLVRPCLPTFSWMERTSMLRLSRAAIAACSVAASTELRISRPEAVSRATKTNEGIPGRQLKVDRARQLAARAVYVDFR